MLENLDWRVFVVVFLYTCVALGMFYAWYKKLDIKTHDEYEERIEEVEPKKKRLKFEETGEVVGTSIAHMAQRLKMENIDAVEKPNWPVKDKK